jgi:hypothetical protein
MLGTVVIFCSSVRAERTAAVAHVVRTYACPQSSSDCVRFCAVLGHSEGVAWRLDADQIEPSFVVATARAVQHCAQDVVDRLFWWSSASCRPAFNQLADTGDVEIAAGADTLDARLVLPAHCPLVIPDACVTRWSHHLDAPSFPVGLFVPAARKSTDAARIAAAVDEWDCHLLAPGSRMIVPIRIDFKSAAFIKPGVIQCTARTGRRARSSAPIPMPSHWRATMPQPPLDSPPPVFVLGTPVSDTQRAPEALDQTENE